MSRFDDFFDAWPDNGKGMFREYVRKGDKKKCRLKWEAEKLDDQADAIIYNVVQRAKFDKGWKENHGKYLSAPLVYLNNERWKDGDFADTRDERRPTNGSVNGLSDPDVRRGVIGCIKNDYTEEEILRAFNISPTEFWDLRKQVERDEA